MTNSSILIIEDDPALMRGLTDNFRAHGYRVRSAMDGISGLATALDEPPDLLLLDIMLPKLNGYEICRRLRERKLEMPIIMLTAKGQEEEIVKGLELCADDYVTKPFSTAELLARVRALFRRAAAAPSERGAPARFGEVSVDAASRTVRRGQHVVDLAPREFDLLLALLQRNGAVASREELLREVWQWENTDIATRTVDIHIAELRRKLEDDPSEPRHILTVRKAGYRLEL
jgi:DNA-binding response OmpR family regulator